MNRRIMGRVTMLGLLALAGASCSILTGPGEVPPRRYWILTSSSPSANHDPAAALTETSIGIGPFGFPSYLERPNLVRRNEPNQIGFWPRNRWAEPLKEGFLRITGENIGHDLGTNRVVLFPWYDLSLDFQVQGEVLRFEVNDRGEVTLHCNWSVYQAADKTFVATRSFHRSRSTEKTDPAAVTQTMSELLGEFSAEVALAIRNAIRTTR